MPRMLWVLRWHHSGHHIWRMLALRDADVLASSCRHAKFGAGYAVCHACPVHGRVTMPCLHAASCHPRDRLYKVVPGGMIVVRYGGSRAGTCCVDGSRRWCAKKRRALQLCSHECVTAALSTPAQRGRVVTRRAPGSCRMTHSASMHAARAARGDHSDASIMHHLRYVSAVTIHSRLRARVPARVLAGVAVIDVSPRARASTFR